MATELVPSEGGHPLPALFDRLKILPVSTKDSFSIDYKGGFFTVVVNRHGGGTETYWTHRSGKGFNSLTTFDPSELTKSERDDVVRRLRKEHMTQGRIAEVTGISQATVSNILRAPLEKNSIGNCGLLG